jgi:flagellar M-ring protein FliF
VNRLSVSVMVDGVSDKAQMEAIQSAVEAAAGIDSKRGDQIVVQSFDFDTTSVDAMNAELENQQKQQQYIQIGIAAGAVLILLALFFLIFRMLNNLRNASQESWKPVLRPVSEMVALQNPYAGNVLPQTPDANLPAIAAQSADVQTQTPAPKAENEDVIVQLRSRSQSSTANEDDQRSRIISRLTEENPATVAEIIQVWLNEGKKSS